MSYQRVFARPFKVVLWSFLLVLPGLPLVVDSAQAESREGRPVLPGETVCPTPLRDRTAPAEPWSEQEHWVWQEVCLGRYVDLRARYDSNLDGEVGSDPKRSQQWSAKRVLTPAFLETILLHDPYRSAITRYGVVIFGAHFLERLNLDGSSLGHALWIAVSRFDRGASFGFVAASEGIVLRGSSFGADDRGPALNLVKASLDNLNLFGAEVDGLLMLDNATIAGHVRLAGGARVQQASFINTRIGGLLAMDGIEVQGRLELGGLSVDADLEMRAPAKASDVNLLGARVAGDMFMTGVKVGTLVMEDLSLDGSLFLANPTELTDADLLNARIGRDLIMGGVKVHGTLSLDGLSVGDTLFLDNGADVGSVSMLATDVGGELAMDGIVVGALLDMQRMTTGGHVFLRAPASVGQLSLLGADVGGDLVMDGAQVEGLLNLRRLSVAGDIQLRERAKANGIDLFASSVDGSLLMNAIELGDLLDMSALSAGGDVSLLDSARLEGVNMANASVGGWVELRGATVRGAMDFTDLKVGGSLDLGVLSEVQAIALNGAEVRGAAFLDGSNVNELLGMERLTVGGHLFLRETKMPGGVRLTTARIGSSLILSGATVSFVDLTGGNVEGDLVLGHQDLPVFWSGEAPQLTLRNARAGAIQDVRESWPPALKLDLSGFGYARLGGLARDVRNDEIASRPSQWFLDVLALDPNYTPQPYEQLAAVLREMGHAGSAKDVLFGGRKRALLEADEPGYMKLWQGLMLVLIGFGYRTYYAIGWIVLFVLLGAAVIRGTAEGKRAGIRFGLAYSLDTLLPIIRLREAHYKIDFAGGWRPARYYFYCHQMMGYVLASFLVAGLSGLTK